MTERFHFHALEKEMATRSSVLAWRIPGMAEPGGLPSLDYHIVGCSFCRMTSSTYCLVAKSCPTLCKPMDCSTPDLPVHQQLLELTQTHVH